LLTTASFLGCVAAGMTFITISGNVMSFALGATAAASGIAFVSVLNVAGVVPALLAALILGGLITGAQGVVVGSIRANPIIVSIAANVLIYGFASWITQNTTVHALPRAAVFKGRICGLPVEFVIFLGVVLLGQAILSWTVLGRSLILIGSGPRAAAAIGLRVVRWTTWAYIWAGLFAAVAGILLAIRYNQANMVLALRYDYEAITAVLVGGTSIRGGDGSMVRTMMGVAAISVIEVVLLLQGFEEQWRYLITGIVVLIMLLLYSRSRQS
jgi:ribose/xylose/arabinose/galactoside ABC-type transport system permease subunit